MIMWHRQMSSGSAGAVAMIPVLVAGGWFYGLVLIRVLAVSAARRSLLAWVGSLWLLFMGYTIWLGWFPPTSPRRWLDWSAWVLAVACAVAAVVVFA
jgi:hypothetical protein